MSIIVTDQLSKNYGSRPALRGVSLSIPEGSLFGFLGPNGAGKSTTIRILLGFLRATTGSAHVFGLNCWRRSAGIKRDVGYLPGDLRLYSRWNGHDALRIVGGIRGTNVFPYGRELASRFELDLAVRVQSMSRGMRQKLGLILAMAHRPRLLILDEPTASLDPLMQASLYDLLREASRCGNTVLFSSHTLSEVQALCDRVAIVREGELVANTTLTELRREAHREVLIRWKKDATVPEVPAFLTLDGRDGLTWRCTIDGSAAALVEWLAGRPVADVEIGPPDLESLFQKFYRRSLTP